MKKIIISFLTAGTIVAFNACGNEEKSHEEHQEHATQEQKHEEKEHCSLALDKNSIELEWTSFKHTAKTPVKGVFDNVEITVPEHADTPAELFKGATVKISTQSVNSGNEGRDVKLKNNFFGTMENTEFITGTVKSIEGDNEGVAVVVIGMNGVEKEQNFSWKLDADNKIIFKTELTVDDWNAHQSLDNLHEVCLEKHTGEDGVSKLWPNVEVYITAQLKKVCK